MKKLILLLLFLAACSTVSDPVETATMNADVQVFLDQHPQAQMHFEKGSFTDSKCTLPEESNRVIIEEGPDKMIVYTLAGQVLCSYSLSQTVQVGSNTSSVDTQVEVFTVQDIVVSAEAIGRSRKEFDITIDDDNIAQSLSLVFTPECQTWRVDELRIMLDNEELYDEVPDCGSRVVIPVSGITQGDYTLSFSTSSGTYIVEDVRYAGFEPAAFELTTDTEPVTLLQEDGAMFDSLLRFNVTEEVEDVVLTFSTSMDGIIRVELNNQSVYHREFITKPRIRSDAYVREENTLVFHREDYNPICALVELEIYEHNDESILCKVPGEKKIQMIFKNTGSRQIDQVDIFTRGDSTDVDTFDLELEPGQIFTRVVDYSITNMEEVVLTPMTDGVPCRSLTFSDIPECS